MQQHQLVLERGTRVSSQPDAGKSAAGANTSGPDAPESPPNPGHGGQGTERSLDDLMATLTALQLENYGQALGAVAAPTRVDPAAGDVISIQTAARFGTHAEMLEAVSKQFAAQQQALLQRFANLGNPGEEADSGGERTNA
ncbi:PE family protein [Mycobacterium helveticum]|uniref:PE family protein n=1 Tax=Mycobacterium helveticum TaxID=2592811 RepID=A0A557XXT8_9MYCO|nr:PE family protein [Mycobacterium helveticum]TVS87007.1 PE family protein [Mycobacterium helveticum]TVS90961.1 PE family protein [Mycobacterium helveticum]